MQTHQEKDRSISHLNRNSMNRSVARFPGFLLYCHKPRLQTEGRGASSSPGRIARNVIAEQNLGARIRYLEGEIRFRSIYRDRRAANSTGALTLTITGVNQLL